MAYGTGLAPVYFWLEARYNPWWLSHTQAEAARVAHRKRQVRTLAAALWVLLVVIALTVPDVLGM
jgi:ribosomal protein L16/L10AE